MEKTIRSLCSTSSTVQGVSSLPELLLTRRLIMRHEEALKSLLIIPRSRSPTPLEGRDIDTLTLEESRELIRKLRERDAAAQTMKREGVKRDRSSEPSNNQAEDGDEVSFVSAKRRQLPITIDEDSVETIDLT